MVGSCYGQLGDLERAISYHERAIAIARRIGDIPLESTALNNLCICYGDLGENARAAEVLGQALSISIRIDSQIAKGTRQVNQAIVLIDQGQYNAAVASAAEAAKIAGEVSNPRLASYSNRFLALARLYAGDLPGARSAAETARLQNSPEHNHNVLALLGVIALRQGDLNSARTMFQHTVNESNTLLVHTPRFFAAVDAKALALSGLALLEGVQHLPAAIEAYKAARAITKAAGIVARVLRLHDVLAEADEQGILSEVRLAAAGEE